MKVAIIHDYLNQYGGAERVLDVLHELFPAAPVFTIVYDEKALPQYAGLDVRTSFVQAIPTAKQGYKNFVFLFPNAIRSFDLKDYDLVISNTHAWAKGIRVRPDAHHICYCLTPMRYIWDLYNDYLTREFINPVTKVILPFWANMMRRWDTEVARSVGHYIAISQTVQKRIKDYYKRDSTVIYPPCDTAFFKPDGSKDDGYYLTVSRLKAYKRIDVLIDAFNELSLPLKVVGEGPELKRLKQKANRNIEFTGWVEDEHLLELYRKCRAFVFASHEDFGLAMVEAEACGKPVIAYGKGGAREIVSEGKTGLLFYEQTPSALVEKIRCFQHMEFDKNLIRSESLRFGKNIFKEKIMQFIDRHISTVYDTIFQ